MSTGKWFMKQTWNDVFFMHWPIHQKALRPFVPDIFELDTYNNHAWIAVIPFRVTNIQIKGLPTRLFGNHMTELNVRTYVTYKGKPGVFFFSLDASHFPGVLLARTLFGLPYFYANMKVRKQENHFLYTCRRTHPQHSGSHFHAHFTVQPPSYEAKPGSLQYWLTERYTLWVKRGSGIYKGPVSHKHWGLQKAEANIHYNTMTDFLHPSLFKKAPTTYYSEHLQATFFPFEKIH